MSFNLTDWALRHRPFIGFTLVLPVLGAGWFLTADDGGRLRELVISTSLGTLAMAIFVLALTALAARRKAAS